ncbi:DEAD/DEAH box helicase [Parafrigoribacterium mesophilum]|uniref:DEAD/DEAH box helicase n=1 Tax=Parafrigoribacterium mesophilum TaxID=433646 RepID=UPI0031FC2E4C
MPPATPPLVDAADILRLVGETSYQRGRAYARNGAVTHVAWDADTSRLTGVVQGSRTAPYRCRIDLVAGHGGRRRPTISVCSCPMEFDCKHVAATLLAGNALSVRAAVPGGALRRGSDWKATLSPLAADPEEPSTDTSPMGLQFELRKQARASSGLWRLGVRPVLHNSKGHWVRANMTWNTIAYQSTRLSLDPEQLRWFCQLAALHRAGGQLYFGYDNDWLYLEDFASGLLWQLIREAQALGISFVGTKADVRVVVAQRAELTLDARAQGHGITVTTMLTIDGRPHPVQSAGTIGTHGVYAFDEDSGTVITLAPVDRPLQSAQRALLGRAATMSVPAADTAEFLNLSAQLGRAIPLTSSDDSVQFPEVLPPVLVLQAAYAPDHELRLAFSWEPRAFRDRPAEAALLARVGAVLRPWQAEDVTLRGIDAAEFTEHTLPALEVLPDVKVEVLGTKPDYRELTAAPQFTITTMDTDQSDWFDLGVLVSIDGRSIPFDNVFRALVAGRDKLLLIDGSYLSLAQPAFEKLRQLIEEAKSLQEWETGLRISRYQSALWAELEELAENTVQARRWRDSVTGLLELDRVEPTEPPPALTATLRPYQSDGFHWLAFLWRHRLGGILADDMGLGKTLQALALILHARESEAGNAAPFLVVAPTSVVSNWSDEAHRFTPTLHVVAVSGTAAGRGTQLSAEISGADVVVTSYTLFRLDFDQYASQRWSGLILDEAQFVKNRASAIHRCARDLDAPFKLAITGTPMENNLMELWALFAIVAPGLFPSARRFGEQYQRPIEKGDEADTRVERLSRLRRRIRPLMMRRTKDVVAGELPAKQEQVLRVELGPRHRKLYDTFLQRERQKLLGLIEDLDRNRFIVFRSLTLLRMLSLDASLVDERYASVPSAKLDALFEQLEDIVAEGHRVLIFSQFTSFLKKAAARLTSLGVDFCYLDGSTPRRGEVIDRFRGGTAPAFLISLKAGGFGLNLTEADYVFLLDPWWNPATEIQAIDRAHRIGQSNNVMVYRILATGTIEEKVMALRDRKAKLFTSVLDDDGIFASALTADDIRGLLESS